MTHEDLGQSANGACDAARVSGIELSTPAAETRKLRYLVPSLFKQKGWAGHWQSLQSDTNCCVFGVPTKKIRVVEDEDGLRVEG